MFRRRTDPAETFGLKKREEVPVITDFDLSFSMNYSEHISELLAMLLKGVSLKKLQSKRRDYKKSESLDVYLLKYVVHLGMPLLILLLPSSCRKIMINDTASWTISASFNINHLCMCLDLCKY